MVKVSIIIPVYNEEMYLEQCLDSLCKQSFQDIEIICIDDGSTDSSWDILKRYSNRDNRIRLFSQKNLYAGTARNVGMKEAEGEYLLFLDADDFFNKRMVEKMYYSAKQDDLDIVLCQYVFCNTENGRIVPRSFDEEYSYFSNENVFSGRDLKDNAIFQISTGVAWNKLFRREFVEKNNIQFQGLRCSNDGFFVYCLMAKAKRMRYLRENLITYRNGNKNSLSGTREKSWENAFQMLSAIRDELEKSNLYDIYEKSFLNYALTHSMGYLHSIKSPHEFSRCYKYIQNVEDSQFHLLEKEIGYFYNDRVHNEYKMVCELEFDRYMNIQNTSIISNNFGNMDFVIRSLREGSSIIIFGAGKIGRELFTKLEESNCFHSIIQVDKNYDKISSDEHAVLSPLIINDLEFDFIIVAINNIVSRCFVSYWLQSMGISSDKIII